MIFIKAIQSFKNPRWLAVYVSFGTTIAGFLGLYFCAYLDRLFPEPYHNINFFGYFDGLAIFCYFLIFAGMFCSAICLVGLLIAAVIFLFRRKHPKQVSSLRS